MNRRSFIKSLIAAALLPVVEKRSVLVKKLLPAKVASFAVPEIQLHLSGSNVVARSRKLKAVWKFEQAADLELWHGLDVEDDVVASIRREYQS